MSKKIVVAKILTSHGVKGYVKLESYMEKPKDIFNYANDLYDSNDNNIKISFIGTLKPNIFITKIEGLNDMDIAKNYRNTELFIDIDLLPKTEDDEYYYNELIGLEARTIDNKTTGIITAVDDYGAGTVIEIKWQNEKLEESLPFIDDYFKEINIDKGYVLVGRPNYI